MNTSTAATGLAWASATTGRTEGPARIPQLVATIRPAEFEMSSTAGFEKQVWTVPPPPMSPPLRRWATGEHGEWLLQQQDGLQGRRLSSNHLSTLSSESP
jgi:hypothetical protein